MKETVVRCDICGKPGASEVSFYVNRRLDAAGSPDNEYEHLDLCVSHQWAVYKEAEKLLAFEQVQQVYNKMLSGVKKEWLNK